MENERVRKILEGFGIDPSLGPEDARYHYGIDRLVDLQYLMREWFKFEVGEGHFSTAHPVDDAWLDESTEEFLVG